MRVLRGDSVTERRDKKNIIYNPPLDGFGIIDKGIVERELPNFCSRRRRYIVAGDDSDGYCRPAWCSVASAAGARLYNPAARAGALALIASFQTRH